MKIAITNMRNKPQRGPMCDSIQHFRYNFKVHNPYTNTLLTFDLWFKN